MRKPFLPLFKGILIIFSYIRFTAAFTFRAAPIGRVRTRSTVCSSSMMNSTSYEIKNDPLVALDADLLSKSLLDLVVSFSGNIPKDVLNEASSSLEEVIRVSPAKNKEELKFSFSECAQERLTDRAITVAQAICYEFTSATSPTRRETREVWTRLQEAGARLQTPIPTESNALSIATVFCCFSLMKSDASKAASSALSSSVMWNKRLHERGHDVVTQVLRALLISASSSSILNLTVISHFAKAFNLDDASGLHTELSANVMRYVLGLNQTDGTVVLDKQAVNGALALARQVHPWPLLPPIFLVEAALPFDFWSSAEDICRMAHDSALNPRSDLVQMDSSLADSIAAVEFLIDTAMEDKAYRKADSIATNLYDAGGKTRYTEARLCHACETIAKVISKNRCSIIELQVDRVDRAVAKTNDETGASSTVRNFALQELEAAGYIDVAHRLATLWNLEYDYGEEAMLAATAARRQKYLQWDDVFPGTIPELLSTPEGLLSAFQTFRNDKYEYGPFGFDAEWDDDSDGAALLQLAHPDQVLLIDVPALSATNEGVSALRDTVGKLMDCPKSVVVGFACRQDLSRLRACHCVGGSHWLSETNAVVDAQSFVAVGDPSLGRLGLSRVSEAYFGKPLDKTEQCSMWSRRPLTERQRIYAALDAWACAALHQKCFPSWSSQPATDA